MMSRSRTLLSMAGILIAGSVLSGCVGGTTYGTGVSQEQQTIEDLANLITFRKKREQIEYKSRPDLVVPEEKVLVNPQDDVTTAAGDQNWPESPEARIARVRAEAEEAEKTIGGQNAFARKKKTVRSVAPGSSQYGNQLERQAPIGQGVPNVSCDPDGSIMRRCTVEEISNAVRSQRAEIRSVGKTGYKRRYLTEPPIEYRTPASTAPVGDQGYTEEELKRIEAAERQKRLIENSKPG